jgi:hypothetical protein
MEKVSLVPSLSITYLFFPSTSLSKKSKAMKKARAEACVWH